MNSLTTFFSSRPTIFLQKAVWFLDTVVTHHIVRVGIHVGSCGCVLEYHLAGMYLSDSESCVCSRPHL